MDEAKYKRICHQLGIEFNDRRLIAQALTPAWLAEDRAQYNANQRLEFFGDSVLSVVIKKWLCDNYPGSPGLLSTAHASMVNNKSLGDLGVKLGLLELQILTYEELQRQLESPKAGLYKRAADLLEAVIGAIFYDQGYSGAEQFVLQTILPHFSELTRNLGKPNTKALLEALVRPLWGAKPYYVHINTIKNGDGTQDVVVALCRSQREEVCRATAGTIQDAELLAARRGLKGLYGFNDQEIDQRCNLC